jgi:hypothetical protein
MHSNKDQSKPWMLPLLGAIASVALLNYLGRQNQSMVLRILFSLWVLGPFLTYVVALPFVKNHAGLQRTMWVITFLSNAIYILDVIVGPAKPTSPFVAIPPLSVLLLAIFLAAEYRRGISRSEIRCHRRADQTSHRR